MDICSLDSLFYALESSVPNNLGVIITFSIRFGPYITAIFSFKLLTCVENSDCTAWLYVYALPIGVQIFDFPNLLYKINV